MINEAESPDDKGRLNNLRWRVRYLPTYGNRKRHGPRWSSRMRRNREGLLTIEEIKPAPTNFKKEVEI